MTVNTEVNTSGIRTGIAKMNSIISTGVKASVASIGAITTALVSTGAAFTKFGMDFTSSFAKPTTLFGDVNVGVKNLQDNILSLSNSSGVSASSLNEGLYSALSAGIPITEDAADAVEFLNKANKLAVAGYTDVDTAITATAKTLNAYGLGIEETARVQNILIQTQNKGIITVDELGKNLAKVTPISSAYGVSIEQVGAAIATLTAKGTGAEESTTQLKNLFTEMGKSGTTFSKMLNEMTSSVKPATEAQLKAMEEYNQSVYDAQVKAYSEQENELAKSLKNQYNETKASIDERISITEEGYNAEIETASTAYKKQQSELEKIYDDRLKALKDEQGKSVDVYKDSFNEQLEAIEYNNDKYIDSIKKANSEALNDFKRNQEDEMNVLKSSHDEKIKLINSEYTEKLKLYDEDKYKAITAINAEIEAIKNKTKEEEASIKAIRDAEKIADLTGKISGASDFEERKRYEKELADFRAELAREAVLAERDEQINLLNERKQGIEDEYNAKVEALTKDKENKLSIENDSYDKSMSLLTEKQQDELNAFKEQQDTELELVKDRLAAEKEEFIKISNEKLDIIKSEYDSRIDLLNSEKDEELSNLNELNELKLSAMRDYASEQLDILKQQRDIELENLEEINDKRLSALREANSLSLSDLSKSQESEYNIAKAGSGDGKTFTDLLNEGYSFVEVLDMVTEYAEKQGVAVDNLFSSSESVLAAMTLGSEGAELFSDNLEAMNTDIDMVSEGYDKMADTLEFKTNRIKETLKNIGTGVFLSSMETDLKSTADFVQVYLDKIYDLVKPTEDGEQKAPSEIIEGLMGIVTEALTDVSELVISGLPVFTELGINIINNIISGILSMLGSLTDVLPEISNVLIENLPVLMENIFNGLSGVLLELVPTALQILIDFIIMVVDELPNYVDKILVLLSQLITDLLTVLGDNADKFVNSLINAVVSIINVVIDFLTKDELNVLVETILDVVTQLIMALANALPKIIASSTEFNVRLLAAIVDLFFNLVPVIVEALYSIVNSIAAELPRLFEELAGRFNALFEEEKDLFGDMPEKFGKYLADLFITALTGLVNLGDTILSWFGFDDVSAKMEEFGANVHTKFVEIDAGVKSFLGEFSNNVKAKVKNSFEGIKTTINNVKGFSKTVGDWLTTSYDKFEDFKSNATEQVSSSISDIINKFNESDLGMYIGTWLDGARTKFDDFKYDLGVKSTEAFNNFMLGLDVLSNFGNTVREKLEESINYVSDFASNLYDRGMGLAESMINGIRDAFNNVGNIFEGIGENLMNGIANGIENTKSYISDKVSEITQGAKDVFGIHSPSKVWEKEIGHYLGEGIVVGFEKDNPVKQIEDIMKYGMDKINIQSSLNNALMGSNRGDYNQTINFNGTTSSPDEIARAVRLQSKYGLAGAY